MLFTAIVGCLAPPARLGRIAWYVMHGPAVGMDDGSLLRGRPIELNGNIVAVGSLLDEHHDSVVQRALRRGVVMDGHGVAGT